MVLVNLSLHCYALVTPGMSGYLDSLNFDSDEDFEETTGRANVDRQHEAAGGGGRGRGTGGGVGRYRQMGYS